MVTRYFEFPFAIIIQFIAALLSDDWDYEPDEAGEIFWNRDPAIGRDTIAAAKGLVDLSHIRHVIKWTIIVVFSLLFTSFHELDSEVDSREGG